MIDTDDQSQGAFSKYLRPVVLATINGIEYSVTRQPSASDTETIHKEVIEKGFMDVNASTGEYQHMTLEEFEEDVSSSSVIKFFASHKDRVVAVMTVHIGLNRIVWVDKVNTLGIQQEYDSNAPALYIGTVVIDPMYKGVDRIGTEMMHQAFKEYLASIYKEGFKPLIFFDCVWKNIPFVPSFVQSALALAGGTSLGLDVFEYTYDDKGAVHYIKFDPGTHHSTDKKHSYFVVKPEIIAGNL
jgi:hypothetical protein